MEDKKFRDRNAGISTIIVQANNCSGFLRGIKVELKNGYKSKLYNGGNGNEIYKGAGL